MRPFTIWFTGISGSGKTTLARASAGYLQARSLPFQVIDGDDVRAHLRGRLAFTARDREIQNLYLGYMAGLLNAHNIIAIIAAISPIRALRDLARESLPGFIEVYCHCNVDDAMRHDTKKLYSGYLRHEVRNMSGIDSEYEPPLRPEVEIRTYVDSVDESAARIFRHLETRLADRAGG